MVTKRKADRVNEAITELSDLIREKYPDASFDVVKGFDPPGTYLEVSLDTDDFHGIMDAVMDRYLEIFNQEGLDIYVMPIRPRTAV
jgi:hypothetical protein